MTITMEAIKPSQNQPVNCTAISPESSCTRDRSRFIKITTMTPQTALKSPNICGPARRTRTKPNTSTAHIDSGINHNSASSCRARFRPLEVAFAPAQLTCTHGRKKHTSTITAALRLMRRISFTPPFLNTQSTRQITEAARLLFPFCALCLSWLSFYRHPHPKLSTYRAAHQKPNPKGAQYILNDGLAYTFLTDLYESRDKGFVVS